MSYTYRQPWDANGDRCKGDGMTKGATYAWIAAKAKPVNNSAGSGGVGHRIQYDSKFLHSLRYKALSVTRPRNLPLIQGIMPAPTLQPRLADQYPNVMPPHPGYYPIAIPVPYMRIFGPCKW